MRHSIRLILALLLSNAYFQLHAQSAAETAASPPEYRHELGLDITGTALQFLQFENTFFNYSPVYNLSYRVRGRKGNWRFGVGGYTQERELIPRQPAFEGPLQGHNRSLQIRAGYEWESQLAPKWEAFYGLDARSRYLSTQSNGGGGLDQHEQLSRLTFWSMGLAPVLGIRWRVSPRISLLTESALVVNYNTNVNETRYISAVEGVDDLSTVNTTTTSFTADFILPLSIYLTLDL